MIQYKELKADLWPALETLFGDKGACGGCWCMWWRVERGGRLWEETKGEPARQQMKHLVISGKARGILAFDGDRAIGWCSFGRRVDFPRIERSKAYRRDDTKGMWCINCFFIDRKYRKQGIARGLLGAAVKAIKRRKAKVIEAYPVTTTLDGKKLPPAFSFPGPLNLYEEFGFKEIQRLAKTKPLVRLELDKS